MLYKICKYYSGNRTYNMVTGQPCISWALAFNAFRYVFEEQFQRENHRHYFPQEDETIVLNGESFIRGAKCRQE